MKQGEEGRPRLNLVSRVKSIRHNSEQLLLLGIGECFEHMRIRRRLRQLPSVPSFKQGLALQYS
jgi:hypothetical protein